MAREIVCHTREDWLAQRRAGVTASEISAILGLSPWLSAFSLYWQKVTGYEQPDNPQMARGRRLEALVREDFRDAHPELGVTHPSGGYASLYASEDRPWQMCTPDLLAWHLDCPNPPCPQPSDPHPTVQPVELKTSATRRGWGPSGSDLVPAYYRAQLLWQMDVFRADEGWLAVWIGLDDYREYLIKRDLEDIAVMRTAAEKFLDNVRYERPPPVDGLASTTATLRRMHPDLTDEDVEVPDDLADAWDAKRREVAAAKAACRELENDLRAKMGSAARAVNAAGDVVATRTVYERKEYTVAPCTIDRLWGRL